MNNVLQLLTEQGHDGFAEGLRLLVNEAMRVERHQVLQAQPYERTDTRKGYANGYKPKTLSSRVGPITFSVPQVRGETDFYPSALEKGQGEFMKAGKGPKGFENLSVWLGLWAVVLVVWWVERLSPCRDGQGQRGFWLPEG